MATPKRRKKKTKKRISPAPSDAFDKLMTKV
jgi:hypothetical protein